MPCLPPMLVQLGQQLARRVIVLPLMATMSPCSKSRSRYSGWSGRLLRRHGPAPHRLLGLGRRVLQVAALRRRCAAGWRPSSRATAARLVLHLDRDAVLLGVGQQLLARQQIPLAPGRDDLDVGLQRIGAELEAHLVVALAGGAVGDGVGAGLAWRSRSGAWRSAAARSRCRAGIRPRRWRWRGTSGRRSRARTPRADRR